MLEAVSELKKMVSEIPETMSGPKQKMVAKMLEAMSEPKKMVVNMLEAIVGPKKLVAKMPEAMSEPSKIENRFSCCYKIPDDKAVVIAMVSDSCCEMLGNKADATEMVLDTCVGIGLVLYWIEVILDWHRIFVTRRLAMKL